MLVPAIINGLCKSGMIKPGMFPSLRIIVTGSAPFKLEQEQAALLAFPGTHLVQGWGEWACHVRGGIALTAAAAGMTETVGSGTMNAFDDPKRLAGSVGRPVPGTELRIVDDDGNDVDEGAQGEVSRQLRRRGWQTLTGRGRFGSAPAAVSGPSCPACATLLTHPPSLLRILFRRAGDPCDVCWGVCCVGWETGEGADDALHRTGGCGRAMWVS